jgi:hypothetical protein
MSAGSSVIAPVLPTPAGICRYSEWASASWTGRKNVGDRQAGQHGANAARDIEADAASGYHAAVVQVECRHAADRESVAPVRVGHHISRLNDPGQRRDIHRLFVYLVIHVADQVFIGVDDRRNAHRTRGLDTPGRRINARETGSIHGQSRHTSTTQAADHMPPQSWPTFSAV